MAGDEKNKPVELTEEDIKIVKQMIEGQKAMIWFKKKSGALATYLTIIIGSYLAISGILKQWLEGLLYGKG